MSKVRVHNEEISMFQKLPVPINKLFVWVFIPYRMTELGLITAEFDFAGIRQELADVFAELGIQWKYQPITLENMYAVVEEVVASSSEYIPVVLNYCDGVDELDGYPGLSVIKLLEAKDIIFTGANSNFEYLSISKIRMKRAFKEVGISTAPYEVIHDINSLLGIGERLGTPLILKPAMSHGSRGIFLQSVVDNDEQVITQVKHLVQGQHGMQFSLSNIFVEKFINGSEFTVFLIGSFQQPESIKIYPPLEHVFHSNLPETEQFFSFDQKWGKCEQETPFPPSEPFCRVQLVASDLQDRLCSLSKRAFCAVSGNGYARVDIRMDKATQELFVLEVNPNCAISSIPLIDLSNPVATHIGSILHLSDTPFAQLMLEIITEALRRNFSKLHYK